MMWRVMGLRKNIGIGGYEAGDIGDSFRTKKEAEDEVERRNIQDPDYYWSIKEESE